MYQDLVKAGLANFLINDPREILDTLPDFTYVRATQPHGDRIIEFGIGSDDVEDGYDTHYYYGIELNLDTLGRTIGTVEPMIDPYTEYEDPNRSRTKHYSPTEKIDPSQLEAIAKILNRYFPLLV